MSKIFISYSSLDSQQAVDYYGALVRLAHEVWMDRADLKGGQEWLQIIQERIRWADTMVVIWSANALASTWVQTELQYAHALGKKIIPVRIDDTSALEHMIVNARQMVDARNHNLNDVMDAIQASIESEHQPGSAYHQVDLPATKDKNAGLPLKWIAGGAIVLLALALVLSLAVSTSFNSTVTNTRAPITVTGQITITPQPALTLAPDALAVAANTDSLNGWRVEQGFAPLTLNLALQQVAMDHVSYLRSLPLAELEQTNVFRTADGRDAQFMAQEAGYNGTVHMLVVITEGTVTLGDLLADIDDAAQYSEAGFEERRSLSTGNQYFVMILGAPVE